MGAKSRRTRTRGTRGGNREPDLGITPEEFHAARQERAGTQIVLTERVAREVAPLIVPSRLEDSIERTRHAYSNPETIAGELAAAGVINPKLYMQMNLWWAQEWLRPDSPCRVRALTPSEPAPYHCAVSRKATPPTSGTAPGSPSGCGPWAPAPPPPRAR